MSALFLLVLAAHVRAEPAPRPPCEQLLASPRPDGEGAADWDACAGEREGGVALPGPGGMAQQPGAETTSRTLAEGGVRVGRFTDPFGRERDAGELLAGAGVSVAGAATGQNGSMPYTAPSPHRSDLGLVVPPAQRVDEGFSALQQPASWRPALDAAVTAAFPGIDWSSLRVARPVMREPKPPPLKLGAVPASTLVARMKPADFARGGGDAGPMMGGGVYGTLNGTLAESLPSMRFKAAVTQSFTSALGMTPLLRGFSVETTPGDRRTRQDHRTLARVDLGQGAVSGFVETGYEQLYWSRGSRKGSRSGVPVKAGVTISY